MVLPTPTIYWSFQPGTIAGSAVTDRGLAGVNGTLINAPVTEVATGKANVLGVDFDGIDQLCRVSYASIPVPSATWTYGVYCRFDTLNSMIPMQIGADTTNPYLGTRLERDGTGLLSFIMGTDGTLGNQRTVTTAETIDNNEWCCALASWDGTDMVLRVYWAGRSERIVFTPAASVPGYDATGFFEIGGHLPLSNDRYMDGIVGEGRWWNGTVLTEDQESEYINLFFSPDILHYPYPENQSNVGPYANVPGLDMADNLILCHCNETGAFTEKAQGLAVDEVSYLTGAGTYSKGHPGLMGGSVKMDGRGGIAFGASDAVYPPSTAYWYSVWFYIEAPNQAIGAPNAYHTVTSRGHTGPNTTYVTCGWGTGHTSHGGRFAGSGTVQAPVGPPVAPVRTWCHRFVQYENVGPDGRIRVWEHHGLNDVTGNLVLDTTIVGFNLDWATFNTRGGKSPWLLGREYALGPAVATRTRFEEFALFDGYLTDDIRQGVYLLQAGQVPSPIDERAYMIDTVVTDDALELLPQILMGTYSMETLFDSGFFKIGEGGWKQSSSGIVRRTPDGSLRRLDNDIQDLDAVVDPTRAVLDQRYASDERYTFSKSFGSDDVLFIAPYIQCNCVVDFTEANDDGFGNSPEFYEIGIFTDHPAQPGEKLMWAYGTMPRTEKTSGKRLRLYVRILFGRL